MLSEPVSDDCLMFCWPRSSPTNRPGPGTGMLVLQSSVLSAGDAVAVASAEAAGHRLRHHVDELVQLPWRAVTQTFDFQHPWWPAPDPIIGTSDIGLPRPCLTTCLSCKLKLQIKTFLNDVRSRSPCPETALSPVRQDALPLNNAA